MSITITITDAAAAQIEFAAQLSDCEGLPLRIAVEQEEDGGLHYQMGFDDESEPGDTSHQAGNATVLIDGESSRLANGMTIDFVEVGEDMEFIFLNPNDPIMQKHG